MISLGAVFGLLAVALLVALLAVWSPGKPGYSQIEHTISELGEKGAPAEMAVALAFLGVGLFIMAFTWLVLPALPPGDSAAEGMMLFAFMGASYAVAGLFHVDPGAPGGGSLSNIVHNIAGGLGYLLPAAGLFLLADSFAGHRDWAWLSPLTTAGAWASLLVIAGLLVPQLRRYRGLVQRAGEAVVCIWVVALSGYVLTGVP